MTSVISSFSQIPVRTKYLLGIPGAPVQNNAALPSSCSAFTLTPGAFLELSSVTTNADICGGLSFLPYVDLSGALFKDMGRQLTIYDLNTGDHIAVFRQVQRVSGAGSEGVGLSLTPTETYLANIYVKVWSADGFGVIVTRTG